MSYQDKINQFQAGLGSQADAFNSAMNNWKTQSENFAMSKVGAHAEYMAQLGGTIAGASAAAHGAFHLAKKAYKARQMRQTTGGNNPEQVSKSTAEHTDSTTAENQQRATREFDPASEGKPIDEQPMGQAQELRTSVRQNIQDADDAASRPAGVSDLDATEDRLVRLGADDTKQAAEGGAKPFRPTAQPDDDLGDVEGTFSKNFGGGSEDFGSFVSRQTADQAQALRAEARPDVDPRFTGDTARPPQADDLSNIQDRLAQQTKRFRPTNDAYAEKVRNQRTTIETTPEGDQKAASALEDIQGQARDEEVARIYGGSQDVADTATSAVSRAQEAASQAGRGYSLLSDVTGGGGKAASGAADAAGQAVAESRPVIQEAGQMAGKAMSSANDLAAAVRGGTEQLVSGEAKQGLASMAKTGIKSLVEKAGLTDMAEVAGTALTEAVPIVGEIAGVGMLIHQLIKSHKEKEDAQKNPTAAGVTASASTEQSAGFDPKSLIGDSSTSATIV